RHPPYALLFLSWPDTSQTGKYGHPHTKTISRMGLYFFFRTLFSFVACQIVHYVMERAANKLAESGE
ncbi:hypothetical protein, partial [uncultured Alistipes sp.]|uniref:hypothetical protein n=1 Tax=uncultured Alistipes sp. TaxID=538949 RepID=UPI0025B6E1DF